MYSICSLVRESRSLLESSTNVFISHVHSSRCCARANSFEAERRTGMERWRATTTSNGGRQRRTIWVAFFRQQRIMYGHTTGKCYARASVRCWRVSALTHDGWQSFNHALLLHTEPSSITTLIHPLQRCQRNRCIKKKDTSVYLCNGLATNTHLNFSRSHPHVTHPCLRPPLHGCNGMIDVHEFIFSFHCSKNIALW